LWMYWNYITDLVLSLCYCSCVGRECIYVDDKQIDKWFVVW
jgi:hypothetical protein